MILVYTPILTNRIRYIFDLLLLELSGIEIQFTTNSDEFARHEGYKFSYGHQPLLDELFFKASGLLTEKGISQKDPVFNGTGYECTFYPVSGGGTTLPFDPFSASFYLITRYEEYMPYKKDELGRFRAAESSSFLHGFLRIPLVNIWASDLRKILSDHFPLLKIGPGKKYHFISTIDIDAAYSYKHKGFFRTTGGFARDLKNGNFDEVVNRAKVLAGMNRDPFDTYDYQLELHKKYKYDCIYFILLGDYAEKDKNLPYSNARFQSLIKHLGDYARIGIHPSFSTHFNPEKLKLEIDRLSNILNSDIYCSRQHFLMLHMPETYRNLIRYGITEDYTMGYASEPGFRAGICSPFYFFDLSTEKVTPLKIFPFAVMEGTLRDYLQMSADEAIIAMKELVHEVKKVNGTFISLWHNESLSDMYRWTGWRRVYEAMANEASQ